MPSINKEVLRKKWNRRYKRRKLAVLNLIGKKCSMCGIEDAEVLQIDHKSPIKQKVGIRPSNNKFFGQIYWLSIRKQV